MPNAIYNKKIIQLVTIGIVVVVLEVAGIWWFYGLINKRAAEVAGRQALLTQIEKERLEFSTIQADLKLVEGFIPRLDTALPTEEQLFGTIAEIDRLATHAGNRQTLTVEGTVLKPSGIEGVSFVSFSAGLTGTYQSLRTYLNSLRTAPFFVRIDTLSILHPESITAESKIILLGRIYLRAK